MGRLIDTISDHPWVDQIPAALMLVLYLALHVAGVRTLKVGGWATITAFHQTLVEAAAGLFGIVFAAIAILRALGSGPRLDHLRARLGPQATQNLKAVIRALGLATIFTILAMALDTPTGHPTLARAATVWVVSLAVVRMIRLVWFFGLVLDLSDRDAEATSRTATGSSRLGSQRGRARAS